MKRKILINILFIFIFFLSFAHPMYASGPDSLVGSWIWLEDQDGTHPVKNSQCSLVFYKDGTMIVSCHKPGQTAEGIGTYSIKRPTINGGMLTLNIPDYGKSATNQSYRIEKDILTLPFTLIGEGNWSRWQRAPEPAEKKDNIPVIAYRAYETALMKGSSDGAAALRAVNEKLHAPAYSHGLYLPARKKIKPVFGFFGPSASIASLLLNSPITLDQAILNASKTTIKVRREGGRVYYILLKSKMPSVEDYLHRPALEPIKPATFVRDPRTHLYMQKCQGPDDPDQHRALLLFPMYTQKAFRKGRYFSFKGVGEDPDHLKRQHQRAGFLDNDIIVKKDSEVTPKLIYDQVHQNPGVLYISSHGDTVPAVSGN